MVDRNSTDAAARRWIEAYLAAWSSNDPEDIRALFTEDAVYRTDPWVSPWEGAEAIVAGWLERADEADTFSFTWEVSGIDGARAFIQGETRYREGPTYSNLWVIDLDEQGRAGAFTEWWMDQAAPS
jgi:ketosteroid isomerase-like protein